MSVNRVTEALLDTLREDADWGAALDRIASSVGADAAALFPIIAESKDAFVSHEMRPSFLEYAKQNLASKDIRYRGVPILLRQGHVIDTDFLSGDQVEESEFYQDFLKRHRMMNFAGVRITSPGGIHCLSLQFGGAFGRHPLASQREVLTELANVTSDSIALIHLVKDAKTRSMLDAFHMSGTAAASVDDALKVSHVNRSFEALTPYGISIKRGQLAFADASSARTIRGMIASAESGGVAGAPTILNQDGVHLIVQLIKPPIAFCDVLRRRDYILLFTPFGVSEPDITTLGRLFDLSPAETNLLRLIAKGNDLRICARAAGISYETARSHLKNIFRKTGMNKQAQLVSLVSQIGKVVSVK